MLQKLKLYLKILLIIVQFAGGALLLSGCWGHSELNEIGLVLTTAIDRDDNGDYQITVMAVVPSGSSTQQSDKSTVWIGSSTGSSIMDASKNLRRTATKKLSWLQNDIIIIGEEAARSGIDDIIDFILRNREIRLTNKMLVSTGRASEIISVPADIEKNLYTELKGMMDNSKDWSKTYAPELMDFADVYISKYTGCVAGRVSYITSDMKTFSTSRENEPKSKESTQDNRIALVSGSSVFKYDKLIDFMDEDETKGYLWIIGKASHGSVVITDPPTGKKLTMEFQKAESKIEPAFDGGKASATVKLKLKGTLVEDESDLDLLEDKDMKAIEKRFENQIVKEMKNTVRKAQKEYKLDIFNFAGAFYRHKPSEWKEIKDKWPDIFSEMEVKYEVKVVISNIGEIQNRVTAGGQQ